ncbi:glutamyl-tRNA(Gln) amidotransferase subunit B, mitochondrial [Patella vulgata]|uniref:glutamyl-tRNA(Gln) amidotransferase subunit B, mitochondrial n=1 Tax=Patella vulgata TaxID=6465 RepID=UPI00217F940D|nr:glutamyl-tRNA(Gln) amidotransferase subunit B, mitochondrial [Patella vulgata]
MAAPMRSVAFACKFCGREYLQNIYVARNRSLYSTKHQSSKWESVIGLEVHAQISSESKLFSGSSTKFAAPINSQVSFFDAAIPGTLPVLNRRCVEAGVKTALALKSKINQVSKFDRKHYFYADLPTGYQITQQREPIGVGGQVDFIVFDPTVSKEPMTKTANLVQIQLEQDSGKSLHDDEDKKSLIDLNRAGIALMEIVTQPDFTTGEEAAGFVKELQKILQIIGTCDGKMSEGSLRVDANISVNKPGEAYGTRTEVKNLNSIRYMVKAIEYEIKRQIKELEAGNKITTETRNFDVNTGKTIAMRDKEKVLDYRFMPEPNLPPLHIYNSQSLPADIPSDRVVLTDQLQNNIPELPSEKRNRLQKKYEDISLVTIATLVNDDSLLKYFEEVIKDGKRNVKRVASLLTHQYLGQLKAVEMHAEDSPLSVEDFKEFYDIVEADVISTETISKVLALMLSRPDSKVKDIIEKENLYQITDPEDIKSLCKLIIKNNPKLVRSSKRGKVAAFNSICSRVMKECQGKTNLDKVEETMVKLLKEEQS